MDIAFFTDSYLPVRDGVASETSALARALERLGHSVTVFAPQPRGDLPSRRDEVDGVPVERIRSVPVPFYGEYRWALFPFPRVSREHFQNRVDVVHLHTPGIVGSTGFLAARWFRKPLVGTFHTNVWAMRGSFPHTLPVRLFFRVAWWYTLGTYWRCDAATAPSSEARSALMNAARKPFRRPVEVIPNGIELGRFHPGISAPDWRERCGLPDQPLATFLGRLTVDKGVHRFLDAVGEVGAKGGLSGIVAGAGPEEHSVRHRLHDDPRLRNVRYVGPVSEDEKGALLGQSNLFVLPSTSDTASVALLEAMACGATCVASNVGGPKEVIRDRDTGYLVDPLAPGELAQAISRLVDNPGERDRLARAGLSFVRAEASIELSARRFISLYNLVMSERWGHDARHPRGA